MTLSRIEEYYKLQGIEMPVKQSSVIKDGAKKISSGLKSLAGKVASGISGIGKFSFRVAAATVATNIASGAVYAYGTPVVEAGLTAAATASMQGTVPTIVLPYAAKAAAVAALPQIMPILAVATPIAAYRLGKEIYERCTAEPALVARPQHESFVKIDVEDNVVSTYTVPDGFDPGKETIELPC